MYFAVFELPDDGKGLSSLLPCRSSRMQPSELTHSSPHVALAELDMVTSPHGVIRPYVTHALVLAFLSHFPHVTTLLQSPTHMRMRTAEHALTQSEFLPRRLQEHFWGCSESEPQPMSSSQPASTRSGSARTPARMLARKRR